MKECGLAHLDRFVRLNADQIPAFTEHLITITKALVFTDSVFPAVQ
jgi:DNA-directed RNA polymerase subunit F